MEVLLGTATRMYILVGCLEQLIMSRWIGYPQQRLTPELLVYAVSDISGGLLESGAQL